MRNKIYSERRRRLHTFFKNVIKNSFVSDLLHKNQSVETVSIDPLTGLYNQFGINSYLKELHPQSGIDYVIVLLSVDNFKEIQHNFGLKSADQALITVASMLSNRIRDTDLVGRYGDNEFILILSDINLDNANNVAKRLTAQIQQKELRINAKSVMLQASCGISVSKENTFSDKVLQYADQALFVAKSHGFNQIRDQSSIST